MRSGNASLDEDMLRKVLSFASPSEWVLRCRLLSRFRRARAQHWDRDGVIFVDILTNEPSWFEADLPSMAWFSGAHEAE